MADLNKCILIVDKKPSRRDTLASRFRLQGIKVELSPSGFQALSMIEKDSYDTVIILGNQQDMSAYELISLMRNVYKKEELQIIYTDLKIDEDIVMNILKQGASEFIIYSEKIFGTILPKVEAFTPRTGKRKPTMTQEANSN